MKGPIQVTPAMQQVFSVLQAALAQHRLVILPVRYAVNSKDRALICIEQGNEGHYWYQPIAQLLEQEDAILYEPEPAYERTSAGTIRPRPPDRSNFTIIK